MQKPCNSSMFFSGPAQRGARGANIKQPSSSSSSSSSYARLQAPGVNLCLSVLLGVLLRFGGGGGGGGVGGGVGGVVPTWLTATSQSCSSSSTTSSHSSSISSSSSANSSSSSSTSSSGLGFMLTARRCRSCAVPSWLLQVNELTYTDILRLILVLDLK